MKRVLLPIFCMAVLFGCTTEKTYEPTTEVGWFTPYYLTPEFLKGLVESLEQKAYWATEQDGEYVQGVPVTLKERDSLDWSDDFIGYFDSLGLAKKVKYLDDEGEAYGHWKVHVEDGKYSKAKWIEGDSAVTYAKYFYDDAGHISKMERYRANVDTLLKSFDFKTDENGNWTSGQWVDYKGEAGNAMTMEYNEAGLVTARDTKNADGDVVTWWKYTYDEKGLQVAIEGMKSDSTMLSIEMNYIDFDEKGNWLKVVYFMDGKLDGMEVRTIEYY